MHITLIGMARVGKTTWADRLVADAGFIKIDCDERIVKRLGLLLDASANNEQFLAIMAAWMGHPYAPQYPENSRQFIQCESTVMEEALEELRGPLKSKHVVLDATGSVIYTKSSILQSLKDSTNITYLQASLEHQAILFQSYIKNPSPVIWGDNAYAPKEGETEMDALKRCYPELLASRAKRYEQIADVIIPFDRHRTVTDIRLLVPEFR